MPFCIPSRRSLSLSLWLGGALIAAPALADTLNVYTIRHHDDHKALYDAFRAESGIDVSVQEVEFETMLEHAGGSDTLRGADVAVIVDAARLWEAEQAGLFDSVSSDVLNERLPGSVRHPEGLWYGMAQRSRVVFFNADNVDAGDLNHYADLADPRFEGQICVRSADNTYNQSLLASIVAHEGEAGARAWAQGVVDNMARAPEGGDRDQISAVASGECNIAIANHYYYVRMLESDDAEQRAAAERVTPRFLEQGDTARGAHMNVSAMGVVADAPHRDSAIRFLEFMTTEQAQQQFARAGHEYPAVTDVAPDAAVEALGPLKRDTLNARVLGENLQTAKAIFERVGWQ